MENKNVFEETVSMLIEDVKSLQKKFTILQEKNDFRGSLDVMRLLKDTLYLIKEYDWSLKYSEYSDGKKRQVSIWEQNHSGEIRNHKIWNISDDTHVIDNNNLTNNMWYNMFENHILSGTSCVSSVGDNYRGSGKSYALAKLYEKHGGYILSKSSYIPGMQHCCNKLGILPIKVVPIDDVTVDKNTILFVDEGSNVSKKSIEKLQKEYIVIGFVQP